MKKKQIAQKLIRAADRALSTGFLALLLLLLFLAVYVTVDNRRIVAQASAEVYQSYKPTADDTISFDELVAINPDVIGWLTIDGTKIDYPLVQGKNNETYINTSVYGEFSLSGSLFLDSRNAPDFSDPLSIVYGHNMTEDVMFGGIDNYADPDYFTDHLSGTLYYGGAYYRLDIFAYFSADGHDTRVYAPRVDEEGCKAWLQYVNQIAVNQTEDLPERGPILLMSTCATGQTNGRDLLAAAIRPGGTAPVAKGDGHISHQGIRLHGSLGTSPWAYLAPSGVVLVGLTILFVLLKRRKKREDDNGEQEEQ